MKTKLFVGNLNFETTDEQLRKLFEPYGPIESVTVVVDKRSGRSKGYGFVQMVESKDAAKALEVSGQEFMGRDIVVTEADSQGEGGEGGRGRRPRSGGRRHGQPRHRPHGSRNHGSSFDGSKPKEKKSWWKKLTGLFSFGKKTEKTEARTSGDSQYPRQHRSRNRRHRRYRGGRGRHPQARSATGQGAGPSQG